MLICKQILKTSFKIVKSVLLAIGLATVVYQQTNALESTYTKANIATGLLSISLGLKLGHAVHQTNAIIDKYAHLIKDPNAHKKNVLFATLSGILSTTPLVYCLSMLTAKALDKQKSLYLENSSYWAFGVLGNLLILFHVKYFTESDPFNQNNLKEEIQKASLKDKSIAESSSYQS